MQSPYVRRGFVPPFVISQVLCLSLVTLVVTWLVHFRGGYAWSSDPGHQFNWHPLLMTLGLIVFYGEGILCYRVFHRQPKPRIKTLHGVLFFLAIVCCIIGLVAVFQTHNCCGKPNLYSLHSWVGLSTVILFCMQWVAGLVTFAVPGLSMSSRGMFLPMHAFLGAAIFILAAISVVSGITEKVIFSLDNIKYLEKSDEGVLINLMGLNVVAYVVTVLYILSRPEFKRNDISASQQVPF